MFQMWLALFYLVKVIVPLDRMVLVSFKWLLKVGGHVPWDGDAEDQGDAHPEWSIQVGFGSDVVLEEGFAGQRNHGVQHSVLDCSRVHIKELLVEFKLEKVRGSPTASILLLVCYQLAEIW